MPNIQSYRDAKSFLDGRESRKVPSIRATEVRKCGLDIQVWYHRTPVITYHMDRTVSLRTNGWHTPTTKRRINEFTNLKVYQLNEIWYIKDECPIEFEEGIRVHNA